MKWAWKIVVVVVGFGRKGTIERNMAGWGRPKNPLSKGTIDAGIHLRIK